MTCARMSQRTYLAKGQAIVGIRFTAHYFGESFASQ